MSAPDRVQDALAKTTLQTHGDGAGAFMHHDIAIIVDKAQGLVARDRFAAIGDHVVALECLFFQQIGLFLVIFRFPGRCFLLLLWLRLILFGTYTKRLLYIFKKDIVGLLAQQLLDVVRQDRVTFLDGAIEILSFGEAEIVGQFIEVGGLRLASGGTESLHHLHFT